jgi:alkylation response protein AidB-like acyl-CoA dehydrogenase
MTATAPTVDAGAIRTSDDPVARARALSSFIRAAADETEKTGTMPVSVVDLIKEAGLFWVLVPKEIGGLGGDILQALGVTEELSLADPSTGWSAMANLSVTGFCGGHCTDTAVHTLFGGDRKSVIAGMFAPMGKITPTGDAWTVTGNFSFGSGSGHADWIGGGGKAVIDGEDAEAIFLVPRENVEFRGNWDVLGLIGTGSFDYFVPEQVVSNDFIVKRIGGVAQRGQASQRLGLQVMGSAGHAGVAMGIARRAFEELYAILSSGKQRPGVQPIIEQQLFRHDFALAEAKFSAARSYCYDVFGDALRTVEAGDPYTELQYQRIRQATTLVTRAAGEAVEFAYSWSGSKGLRQGVLGRCMRDMHAATQHVYIDPTTLVNAAAEIFASYQYEN